MNATQALGWALVHFLWQGAALAVVLATALAVTRHTAARTRYVLSLATLAAMLVLPVVTAVHLYRAAPAGGATAAAEVGAAPMHVPDRRTDNAGATRHESQSPVATTAPVSARLSRLRPLLDPALPWLVLLWVGGVLLFSIRLVRGWTAARGLRTHGAAPAAAPVRAMLERLVARLRVRRPVELLESALVQVPAVIGWLRPVILVPASALTGLPPQQLELLLAHELAHVRRYDYLVNLVQSVIEALLFYHPAVWWVSRRIREEREHCCDDLVVQVCGDAHGYATALVGMERLRTEPPQLALAATGGVGGGSLLHRVRRLIRPGSTRREILPPWIAGVIAVTVALLAAGGAQVAGSSPPSPSSLSTPPAGNQADTTRSAPDTVIQHPDPSRLLAQRWEWAHTEARRLGRRVYWIGYRIARPAWLEHLVYIDREVAVTGPNITIRGRMFGDFEGLLFRGSRLAPLLGRSDSDDIAMLFGFSGGGLVRVHIASFHLPVDFANRTLVWLGDAPDAESIPLAERLMGATQQPDLREDVVGAVGIHGSSNLVVPILVRWLTGRERADIRGQAAEWLGFHPTAAAVNALSRAARGDADRDVRREAAEALGDSALPAATDSAIAIARTATDSDVRREAVEALGEQDSEQTLAALVAIAHNDRDVDVQREAVETLGEMPSGRGLNAVRDLARTHPHPEIRREAVETIGEAAPPAQALELLGEIARRDRDPDVQREAVQTLGELHDARAYTLLVEFARTHPVSDVRREAIETYAENAPSDLAVKLLNEILGSAASEDIYSEVLQSLEELEGGAGIPALIEAARSHPNRDVRAQALRRLAESDDPRAQELFERALRGP